MTAEQFKQAQETLGLNNPEMADLLCCSLRLVEKMRQGERAVSARSEKMIKRALESTAATLQSLIQDEKEIG